jgi:TolB protein
VSGRIAFPAWDAQQGKYHTYIAQAKDGGERRLLIEGMHQPAFNPEGSWLAVNGEQPERMNLFILREDGSSIKKVADFIEDGLPAWSPDGRSLAFSSTRHGDKQSRVYVIDEVPLDRGRASDRALNFGPDDVRGTYPTWAPGDLIVYQGCDLTVEPGECGLYSISSLPGPQPATRLTEHADDTAPAAYGDRVAFMSNRDGNWEVYIMNIDGSGVKRLTNDGDHDGLPTWSPDGKTIAFVSNRSGTWAIWAMNPDGSSQRKLFDIGAGGLAFEWQQERLSWAP